MSLMDVINGFRGVAPPQQQGAVPPKNPDPSLANPTAPGAATAQSDGSVPAIPAAKTGTESPLDGYKDLWQKADTDKQPTPVAPAMKVDPAKLSAAANNIDFTKSINADALAKAATGDAASLALVINQAARAGLQHATAATATIVEAALAQQGKMFRENVLPDAIKAATISQSLGAENPVFEHPAVAPVLNLVKEQLQVKFPNASASEIASKAREYVGGMAGELVKASGKVITDAPKPAEATQGGTDWAAYFGVDNSSPAQG
jgi:hypothetical protein